MGRIRSVGELQCGHRRGRARYSDADQLGRLTDMPAVFWMGSFGLIAAGALIIAGGWLLT